MRWAPGPYKIFIGEICQRDWNIRQLVIAGL